MTDAINLHQESAIVGATLQEPDLSDFVAIALDGLRNIENYKPIHYDAPIGWLRDAIEHARAHGKLGNVDAARAVIATTLANADQRRHFGIYREKVTYIESQNAKRLGALAWCWHTLDKLSKRLADKPDPKHDRVEIERLLLQAERFAYEHWLVVGLSIERGWAEKATRQPLLPPAWLNA